VFVLLLIPLARTTIVHRRGGGFGNVAIVTAVVVGVLLCAAAIKSSPALPPVPDQPYETAPAVCRTPYEA
jgi:hypothetical protein